MIPTTLLLGLLPMVFARGYRNNISNTTKDSTLTSLANTIAQLDTGVLDNASGLDLLVSEAAGLDLPADIGHLDYRPQFTAVNVDKDTLPSLVEPNTRPNVLYSPDRRVSALAGSIYRSEELGPDYTVNYRPLYFGCAAVVAGEPAPLACTVTFTSDTGATADVESPGNRTLAQAELNFKDSYSLAIRIKSLEGLEGTVVKRASLFVDSFRDAINPGPPTASA